jgi:uncharacterized protein YcbK (DUF882 family)
LQPANPAGAAQPGAKEPVDERKCPAESTPKKQALKNSSEDEEENDEDDEEDDEDDEEDDEDNHSDSDSMLSQVSTPVSKKSKKKGRSAKIDECGFDDLQISSQLSGNGSQHKVISVYKDPMMSQHVLPNWVLQDGSVDGIFDPSFKNASRKTTSCPRH